MGHVVRSAAVLAATAVVGATISPPTVERQGPASVAVTSAAPINLTAASSSLPPWPLFTAPGRASRRTAAPSTSVSAAADATPGLDQVDADFIAFRTALRTDFHEFVNKTGYLGKQMYIAFNFGESILASAVFNGTDVLRGEGLLTNLGEFAYDVFLAAVYIVADELYLNIPGLPPAVILPPRAPDDHPPGWQAPLPPQPGRPVVLPVSETAKNAEQLATGESTSSDETPAPEEDTGAEGAVTGGASKLDESSDSDTSPAAGDGDDDRGDDDAGTGGPEAKKVVKKRGSEKAAEDTGEVEASKGDGSDAPTSDQDSDPDATGATQGQSTEA